MLTFLGCFPQTRQVVLGSLTYGMVGVSGQPRGMG